MGKDPAILFYTSDFLTGTTFLTYEEKGQYITLLCQQHQLGVIPEGHMINMCGSLDSIVVQKFTKGKNGYYNERMKEEAEKRASYCKSRRNNKMGHNQYTKKVGHMTSHMSAHMENENENRNKDINRIEKGAFERIWNQYPKRIGKKTAMRHFKVSVKTKEDLTRLEQALVNYLSSKRVKNGFVQNGSTFMNNWEDWVSYKEETCQLCNDKGSYISSTGYSVICECPAGKRK